MNNRPKTPILLIEITVMLLVFALCAAICLTIFATADRLSDQSQALDQAVLLVQSTAERYKAFEGDLEKTAHAAGCLPAGETAVAYFDHHWQTVTAGDAVYRLVLEPGRQQLSIRVEQADGSTLFSVEAGAVR